MDTMAGPSPPEPGEAARPGRRYDTSLRRRRAAETRERIITAGSELLHASSIRDWRPLTIRAVANQAGVNERTVYRYFGNEQGLREAVMHRLEEEAGIDLSGMRLEDIPEVAARIFEHVSSYPLESRPPLDPTLTDANERQRRALVTAVSTCTERWADTDRVVAAAVFDVLWSVASYERLVLDWHLDEDLAAGALTWAIGLVEKELRSGEKPGWG